MFILKIGELFYKCVYLYVSFITFISASMVDYMKRHGDNCG